jgi:two-component sensor histidine kinase
MVQQSEIKERLMDRLQSMSATNRVITDSMGDGVRLLDLIKGGISGFESQFEISGAPGLVLGPQMTQNFSLILHELLTNALKHGALSVPQGRVKLRLDWTSWVLTFVWEESGGPAVSPPAGTGFGSRILGDFARSFCQNVEANYAPGGFRYSLQIHSDQNRFAESSSVSPMVSDVGPSDVLAPAPAPAGPEKAETSPLKEIVLHDWELYQAGKGSR